VNYDSFSRCRVMSSLAIEHTFIMFWVTGSVGPRKASAKYFPC
jgi:hypothetical protein